MDNNKKKKTPNKTPKKTPKKATSHERMSREAFKSVVKFGNIAYPFALADDDDDDSQLFHKNSPIISGGGKATSKQQQQPEQQQRRAGKSPTTTNDSPEEDWDKLDGVILIDSAEELHKLKVFKYKEIKHYIKGEVLGRGKFGVVREFIDKRTLKRYAGKIIRRGIINRNYHLRQQINKELAITYHFKHRNVLRVYDLYATRQKIYMFMEFCFGELAEFIKAYGRLPPFQAKDYFSQIIEGLHYLHSHGIIHRDVKPENILITPDHTIKLADYGVCQEVSYFTIDDSVFGCDGTPLYHPPELFNQKILTYSGSKIDIWAAGVVLFKMLTGRLPFFYRDNTNQDDIDEILNCHVQYPELIRSDVLLLDLLNKIFEKDFKQRISITEIKKHPWMQVDYNQKRNEKYFVLPTEVLNSSILDSYRGLTVHTRIYNKYYPPQHAEQFVSFRKFQESCKMLPLTRGSRYVQEPKRISLIKKRIKIKFL